jgi:hypothetical protein
MKLSAPCHSGYNKFFENVLSSVRPTEEISGATDGVYKAWQILGGLQEPKTMGMQAIVKALRDLLLKLEEDLKALERAYTNAKKRKR